MVNGPLGGLGLLLYLLVLSADGCVELGGDGCDDDSDCCDNHLCIKGKCRKLPCIDFGRRCEPDEGDFCCYPNWNSCRKGMCKKDYR